MHKLIIASLAVLCAVSAYAQQGKDEEETSEEVVVSDEVGTGSFYKDHGCKGCGDKTKK